MEALENKVQELSQKEDVSGKYFKNNSNLEFKEIWAGEMHF